MRIGNHQGRLVVIDGARCADVELASGGRFSADPADVYDRWEEFVRTAGEWRSGLAGWVDVDPVKLGPPSPSPRQIFAVGVNYAAHSDETGIDVPDQPMIFTKFASSLTGPVGEVALPSDTVDWEVEIVAVIGKHARDVSASHAHHYIAGLTIGQDISERTSQMAGSFPQFSLAKSYAGFTPIGPVLVTLDEIPDLHDVTLHASINGRVVQNGNTADMIFSIPVLIEKLSAVCTLFPGDVIFTGTPDGVGMGLNPPQYLSPGDELVSGVPGIGVMRQTFVASGSAAAMTAAADASRG